MAARSAKNPRPRATESGGPSVPQLAVAGSGDKDKAFRCIRALVAALQTSARAVEEHTGLTNAQLFLLRQIAGSDRLTINDLSHRTSAAQSSVSVVVARLVRAGHVKRGRVAGDGRRVTLTATARGRTAVRKAPPPATERLLEALGAITASDARSISRGVGALLSRLGTVEDAAPLLFETRAG